MRQVQGKKNWIEASEFNVLEIPGLQERDCSEVSLTLMFDRWPLKSTPVWRHKKTRQKLPLKILHANNYRQWFSNGIHQDYVTLKLSSDSAVDSANKKRFWEHPQQLIKVTKKSVIATSSYGWILGKLGPHIQPEPTGNEPARIIELN